MSKIQRSTEDMTTLEAILTIGAMFGCLFLLAAGAGVLLGVVWWAAKWAF